MKKRTKIILGIGIPFILLTGGIIIMQTPFDIFLTRNFAKEAEETSLEGQLAYLKKHEKEWTNAIRSQNSKITSIQYDWDSVKVGVIGNGTPQGAGYALTLSGGFNDIKDSSFTLSFDLEDKNALPNGDYYLQQPLRVVEKGVDRIYE